MMRIEVENDRTPLIEFVANLVALGKPVDLMRKGKVVRRMTPNLSAATVTRLVKENNSKPNPDEFWTLVGRARAKIAKLRLTTKRVKKLATK